MSKKINIQKLFYKQGMTDTVNIFWAVRFKLWEKNNERIWSKKDVWLCHSWLKRSYKTIDDLYNFFLDFTFVDNYGNEYMPRYIQEHKNDSLGLVGELASLIYKL